jgi:hypothetical protein
MEGTRALKPGELVQPDCGSGARGSAQVPVWGHPIRRHWRDNVGWWLRGQSGVVIELWEGRTKHDDSWLSTGYKYKIMAPNGIIGWVEQSDILPLDEV